MRKLTKQQSRLLELLIVVGGIVTVQVINASKVDSDEYMRIWQNLLVFVVGRHFGGKEA